MAGFHGPGGSGGAGGAAGNAPLYPNMQTLNAIPSDYDLALQHQRQHAHPNGYDFQADLDMFTNTQFFDFDMADVADTQSPTSEETPHWNVSTNGVHGSVDFLNGGDLQQVHNYFPSHDPNSSRHPSVAFQQQQPTLPSSHHFGPSTAGSPTSSNSGNQAGDKRKAAAEVDASSGTTTPALGSGGPEDASRVAAEEDKRRRNTAASARFRVKKKQREQALEKSAKDMTDRVTYLENRVSTLEMENKLLKDLITEKSGQDVNIPELTKRMAAGAKDAAAAAAAASAASDNAEARSEASEKSKREVKIEKAEQKQQQR